MDMYILRVINVGRCEPNYIYIVSEKQLIYRGDAAKILSDIILKVQVRINVLLEDKIYPKSQISIMNSGTVNRWYQSFRFRHEE